MSHAERIAERIEGTEFLAKQLAANPQLWGEHPLRTLPGGPFVGTSDIWVRFQAPDDLMARPGQPHESVWYPCAEILPAARMIADYLLQLTASSELGGILITRIPAGGEVKTHHDRGGWHAEHYNAKVYVVLQGNEHCVNYFEDEAYVMQQGEAWRFNNLVPHSVKNDGPSDRISLIVCMRRA